MRTIVGQSASLRLVEVVREKPFPNVTGHLWWANEHAALLSPVNDSLALDGFVLLPSWQKSKIRSTFDGIEFLREVLCDKIPSRLLRQGEKIESADVASVISVISRRKWLVMVHPERKYLDTAYVGWVTGLTKKHIVIDAVSAKGELVGEDRIELRSTTRLEFCTQYLGVFARYLRTSRSAPK